MKLDSIGIQILKNLSMANINDKSICYNAKLINGKHLLCIHCPMSSYNSNGAYDCCVNGGPICESYDIWDSLSEIEQNKLTKQAATKFLAQHVSLFEEK